MIISDRLCQLREGKKLSQGDIEKRTGLLRCYISRVENGHRVPAIETLDNWRGLSKFRSTSFSMTGMSRQAPEPSEEEDRG
jgi:transcriptional regulator with XRE-family HTH domain